MAAFPFDIEAVDGAARTGRLRTPRGDIETPAFMPVGTAGTVKALTVEQVRPVGRADPARQHLSPDASADRRACRAVGRVASLHALDRSDPHRLRRLSGHVARQDQHGARGGGTFQSHIDGSRHILSPERSIEIQADLLGSDIVMQLDECVA